MPVIGFNINKIEAEKKKLPVGAEIKISNTPKISSIEVDALNLGEKKGEKILKIAFDFLTEFEPKVGHISLSGEMLYLHDDAEELMKTWKKEHALPGPVMVEIMNYLFRRCLIKILSLTEDLQLPPVIPFPLAKLEGQDKKESKYIK
jgi:hypothetical protein